MLAIDCMEEGTMVLVEPPEVQDQGQCGEGFVQGTA